MTFWNVSTMSPQVVALTQLMFWPIEDSTTLPPLQAGDEFEISAQSGADVFQTTWKGRVVTADPGSAIVDIDGRQWRIRAATSSDVMEMSVRRGPFKTWIVREEFNENNSTPPATSP